MNFLRAFNFRRRYKRGTYDEDALRVDNRKLSFLTDPSFMKAWNGMEAAHRQTGSYVPEIRWRAFVCVQAARQGLNAPGDFVECGVNTGIFSLTACRAPDRQINHHLGLNNVTTCK